jgi:N-methylhydantoinase A
MLTLRVATDVGGTFTDLVYYKQDDVTGRYCIVSTAKTDTTPPNFEEGVMNVIEKGDIDPALFGFFAHGTTVVINALLSRKGAKVGLLTTKGFRDVLEIARGNRPDLFNFKFHKPKPFVERYLRLEIDERTNHLGEIEKHPDINDLVQHVDLFREEGVESIAVCFLHSYLNPENERLVAQAVRKLWPDVSVVPSHTVTREWREYERTNTAVMTAYVHPTANRYLEKLQNHLRQRGFTGQPFIMQSNGGIDTIRAAAENPITMVESGAASGMLGAIAIGSMIGEQNLIALDIGGTTAKCSLIADGAARISTGHRIEWSRTECGYPIMTPVLEIVEIGNGGGSIAWVDHGGKLHVGPRSAGALPGPASYGKGGSEPTTTDAHLLTGRIGQDNFIGGKQVPDMVAVERVFSELADKLSVTKEQTALGVIRIANSNMTNALKLISVNKGYDPRDFALITFGGGGAMHAIALAQEIGARKVIVPANAGVFSAWGMLMTDLRRDLIKTEIVTVEAQCAEELTRVFSVMRDELLGDFVKDGLSRETLRFESYLDMRYEGQEHTVKVQLEHFEVDVSDIGKLVERFHARHEQEYTYRLSGAVEIVNYHLVGFSVVERPDFPELPFGGPDATSAMRAERSVLFDDGTWKMTPVYQCGKLLAGMQLSGPAVIESPDSTTIVPPDHAVEVDRFGNLHISISKDQST